MQLPSSIRIGVVGLVQSLFGIVQRAAGGFAIGATWVDGSGVGHSGNLTLTSTAGAVNAAAPNGVTVAGVSQLGSTNATLPSGGQYLFSSGNNWTIAADVGLARSAAGVLRATNGGAGDGYLAGSVATGVAAAGTTQGAATALSKQITEVATATGGSADGVILPTAVAGRIVTVCNRSGATLKIYPATGGQIDALGANAAYSLATLKPVQLVAVSATQWYTILGA